MSPPLPELLLLRRAVDGRAINAIEMFQVADTIRTSDGGAMATVPCGHQLPLSPSQAAACRTMICRCPDCGAAWRVTPVTNDLLAALGSHGPFPASGLTALVISPR